MTTTDWEQTNPNDLWIYDKLILAIKLGYKCGPVGVDVPKRGKYIVRPITNVLGMGIDAEIHHLRDNTDFLPPGHFWCEWFEGRHLSVDYVFEEPVLCVEGNRDQTHPLWRWDTWQRVPDRPPFPDILKGIGPYEKVNCEFIGNKLIEVQLRHNTDLGDYDVVVPEWRGEPLNLAHEGYTFIPDRDYNRIGFWKRKYDYGQTHIPHDGSW